MALNKSAFLIRDYENIRQILRDIYIYGCFSRDDFIEKKGISGRKYDKEQQRIRAYLPRQFIQKRRVDKKVQLYCTYDMLNGADNYLADTYRNKSFTVLDIMAFFFVQQLLNEYGELTVSQLLDKLPVLNDEAVFTKDNLRIKLDELLEKGYIKSRKEGRKVFYSLSDDIWKDFEDDELMDLCIYLEFLKNVSPLEMPYHFLYQKLRMYLVCERNVSLEHMEIFQFKHNHLFNSLDNDVLLEILRAKQEGNCLEVKFYHHERPDGLDVIPGEIIHDSTYGRQYLYCCDIEEKVPLVIRLDKISSVRSKRTLRADEHDEAKRLASYSQDCWCTSGVQEQPTEIVIEFRFDEDQEKYIYRRIISEGHGGEIKRKAPGVYEYRLRVRDPDEMIPWIRSFGERAKVLSSGSRQTELKIAQDWKKAVEKYESL